MKNFAADTAERGRTRRIWRTYKQRPHENVRALRAYLPGHGDPVFLPTRTWVPLNHMNADMDAPFCAARAFSDRDLGHGRPVDGPDADTGTLYDALRHHRLGDLF